MKKKFKELKDKQKVLAVFGILGLVLILTGVTYAFFSYTKEGTTENTLKSGSITFWYDEINQSGNSISIEDALPMSDEQGKQQTQAFNFKIQSTTSSTTTIPYEITLRQKQGTDDIGSIVKVYLAKTSALNATIASEEEIELSLFSELSNVTKNGYSEKLLHTDLVPASDSPYTQFYRLKMWIDGNTDYSQVENSTTHEMEYPYNNKTFTVTVNVYANGHVLDGNSGTASINSVSVGGTELTSTTVGGIDTYSTTLPEGTTSTTISVDTGDYDQVTITKTASDYTTPVAEGNNIIRLSNTVNKRVSLTDGSNFFKIVATSEDGNDSKEIHVKIVSGVLTLNRMIKDNNPLIQSTGSIPNVSTSSNNTEDPSGLYSLDVTNGYGGANGTTYYFRGNVTNNYVSFAGQIWRIIRINEDGSIRIMLDDRTVVHSVYNSDINNYDSMYYSNSEAKATLNTWYANNIGNNNAYASKIANGSYFCESLVDDSTLNFVCNTDANNKGLLDSTYKIGLLTYDEVVRAGGYWGRDNSEYYLYPSMYGYVTMTPAGYSSSKAFATIIWNTGSATYRDVNYDYPLRAVINLKADVLATGTGTSTDPYVIQ